MGVMSKAFFVTCATCKQVVCQGDGVGPPVYTSCGCPSEVDKLRAQVERLEVKLRNCHESRERILAMGRTVQEDRDHLRAREERLERHIAELNSRDFGQEVFTLEAEIDELCAQVGEIADLLDDFGTSHPSDVIRYKCAERLRNLSRYGLFLVKRERR
jgi:hypothetical protein